MVEKDYRKLVDGLKQVRSFYNEMLVIVKQETEVIKSGENLKKLLDSGSKKMALMQKISAVDTRLAGLKSAWQSSTSQGKRNDDEASKLLGEISDRLRKLLNHDSDNGQLLNAISRGAGKTDLVRSPIRAAAAYTKTERLKV
jgi:flagellar biosynthesis/type III secretory pathway chaperone